MFFSAALVALIASLITLSNAHTWIEEMQVISKNGTYIGDRGFSRGYVARTDPTFDGDANILWMLPSLDARMPDGTVRNRINSSDLLCGPNQMTKNYTNPEYPKLKVAPGSYVAMKYLENGHVTLPWNVAGKPLKGGTAFVYGTTQPSTAEKIADVLKWNTKGTGGDGRGWLMSAQNFDDGRCHQINDCVDSAIRQVLYPNMIQSQPTAPSQEQWCETDLKIPHNQKPGDLTVYWVWQWPTHSGEVCVEPEGKDEYYTTCSDFEVMDAGRDDREEIAHEYAGNTLIQENFQTKAVSTWTARTALTTSPSFTLQNWKNFATTVAPERPAFSSSCAIVLSSMAAYPDTAPPPSCPADRWATGALFASVSSSVLAAKAQGIAPMFFVAPSGPGTPAWETGAVPASTRLHQFTTPTATSAVNAMSDVAPTTEVVASTVIFTTVVTEYVTATFASPAANQYDFNTISTVARHRAHARQFG